MARNVTTFRRYDPATTVYYARVSTRGQDYKSQIAAFKAEGALDENIFADKISGAAKRLPKRDLAIRKASRPGWRLVVTKLDRLGRKVRDVLNIVHDLEDEGATFATLDGVDTSQPLVGKLLLGMLALVAEFEHGLISTRTKTGMAYRKSQGAKFGKKRVITDANKGKIRADLEKRDKKTGELAYSLAEVAKRHKVSMTTLNNYFPAHRTKKMKKTLRGVRP